MAPPNTNSPPRTSGRRIGRVASLATVVALATAALVAPTGAFAADEPTDTTGEGLVAWYKLNETAGTTVADSSGNSKTANVEGAAAWNAGAGFTFSGGNASAGNSIKLPNNIVTGLDSVTVSADVLVDTTLTGSVFMYTIGNVATGASGTSGTGYLFQSAPNYQAKITPNGYGSEKTTAKNAEVTKGVWKHLSYTQTGTVGTLYEDGVQVAQNTAVTVTPGSLGGGVTSRNYLGKSAFAADPSFKGRLRDFRIYNRALSQPEVAKLSASTAAEDLAIAKSALTISGATTIQANITLPTTVSGAAVKWSSSMPYVLSSTGKVIRPSENKSADVTLTATINVHGQTATKEFAFTVLPDPNSDGKAQFDAETVVLGDTGNVRENLTLPTVGGTFSSALDWTSSKPGIVSSTGEVVRPAFGAGDATVALTATASIAGSTGTAVYSLTVPELERVGESAEPTVHTAVSLSPASIGFGQSATATATLTASDGGDVVGTVTFTAGSFVATVPVVDGTAVVALPSTLALGSTVVTAAYSGYKQLPSGIDSVTLVVTDIIAPVSVATVAVKARTVTIVATDTQSDVARIEYRVGSSNEWMTYTAPIVVGSGAATVEYRAVDAAGNTEAINSAFVADAASALLPSKATVVTVTPMVAYGAAGSLTLRVTGAGSVPTGTVRVFSGDVLLANATLANGRATIALSKTAAVKVHSLTVRYAGNADYAASAGTSSYSVTKATARATATAPRSIRTSVRAKVAVTVTAGSAVSGKATVRVIRSGKTVTTITATLSSTGKATVTLPKLKKGSYSVKVSYAGSSTLTAATVTRSLTVRK